MRTPPVRADTGRPARPTGNPVGRPSDGLLSGPTENTGGMPTRYTVVCDDDRAREIEAIARQYDLTEEEVLRQLVDTGLDHLEEQTP